MELLKKLKTRKRLPRGYPVSWGLFHCSYCHHEMEKELSDGKKNQSCGCVHRMLQAQTLFTHGEGNTRLYSVWSNFKGRCLNSNDKDYHHYGGRGITVCQEWLEWIPFRDWALFNGYKEGLLLDRRDNNKGYYPENCRFVNYDISNRNQRRIHLTEQDVIGIREIYATLKLPQYILGKMFHISQSHVSRIVNDQTRQQMYQGAECSQLTPK